MKLTNKISIIYLTIFFYMLLVIYIFTLQPILELVDKLFTKIDKW